MIQVTVDNRAALAALQALNPARIRSRLQGAVRKTLDDAKSFATAKLNARYTRPDFATSNMKLKVAGLNGSLSVSDKRHGLTQYVVNPNTRPPHNPPGGLTAKVRRADNERLPHAFIGRGQAFERVGKSRLPLRRLTGPSGAQMLGSKHIAPQVESRIAQHIQSELGRLF